MFSDSRTGGFSNTTNDMQSVEGLQRSRAQNTLLSPVVFSADRISTGVALRACGRTVSCISFSVMLMGATCAFNARVIDSLIALRLIGKRTAAQQARGANNPKISTARKSVIRGSIDYRPTVFSC